VRTDVGTYFAQRYAEFNDHPLVGEAQSCGFVGGLVLVKDKKNKVRFQDEDGVGMLCRSHCFANGLIMRAVGDRMIIAPPLTMTRSDIDDMVRLIRIALDLTWRDLKARNLV
jgi:putrescine---pyruvate transaminase